MDDLQLAQAHIHKLRESLAVVREYIEDVELRTTEKMQVMKQ